MSKSTMNIVCAIVTTKFWQQDFILSKLLTLPSGGSDSLLDGYSMARDFGIYIASRKDDKSISKRIEVSYHIAIYTNAIP